MKCIESTVNHDNMNTLYTSLACTDTSKSLSDLLALRVHRHNFYPTPNNHTLTQNIFTLSNQCSRYIYQHHTTCKHISSTFAIGLLFFYRFVFVSVFGIHFMKTSGRMVKNKLASILSIPSCII